MTWDNPLRDQLQRWMDRQNGKGLQAPKEDETLVDVVRFSGLPSGVKKEDFKGSFLSPGPMFEYDSSQGTVASLKKAHGSLPSGLVQVLYGSLVDVTDPYPYYMEGIPTREFEAPPDPSCMRGNPCGVKIVDYSMLFILSQQEHPGVVCRFLISGTPLDYEFWFSRRARKQQRVDFAYQGEEYSFRSVPAIQVAMQGLMDVTVDPGVLLHGLYQSNIVQVRLLKESLDEGLSRKSKTPKEAQAIMEQEEGLRRSLEADLMKYTREPLPIFIVHRKPDNVYVAERPSKR